MSDFKIPPVQAIVARNPDYALHDGLWWLKIAGEENDSRNGRVIVAPAPVLTLYPWPQRRVMASALRDANPFFHLFEALWMLAGRNDAAKVAGYAKQMETFADDGLLWGAYGYRWRRHFHFDQLAALIQTLTRDPKTRRAVLTMWDASDLAANKKDIPCNTHIYFDATRGKLDMTVSNRSNDVVWGAYGANLVHMSILQEFVACATGIPVGTYFQFSNNFHIYPDRPDVRRLIDTSFAKREEWTIHFKPEDRLYNDSEQLVPVLSSPLDWYEWLRECESFVADPLNYQGRQQFLYTVAQPLMQAHAEYKRGNHAAAVGYADLCAASDWRTAALEWLERRRPDATLPQVQRVGE